MVASPIAPGENADIIEARRTREAADGFATLPAASRRRCFAPCHSAPAPPPRRRLPCLFSLTGGFAMTSDEAIRRCEPIPCQEQKNPSAAASGRLHAAYCHCPSPAP